MGECAVSLPLHEGQRKLFLAAESYKRLVLVAGRRWGKGEVAAARLTLASLREPEHFAYIAPSYKMARRIEWPKSLRWAQELTRQTGIKHRVNRSDLLIEWATGGSVGHYGADNPDSLRGVDRGFAGVVMDEFDFFRREPGEKIPYLWDAVIEPALTDTDGWAQFQGTPDGFGGLYQLHKRGLDHVKHYKSFHYRSIDNPLLDRTVIEEAKASKDPRLYRQEYEASFEAPGGTVYDDFSRKLNASLPCPFDKRLQVIIGMDFNVNPMTAVMVQAHGPELWVPWSIEQANSHTSRIAGTLRATLAEFYGGEEYPEPELWVDPSGAGRQHNIGTSDVSILEQAGFDVHYRPVYAESDKHNAVRAFILNAKGERRLRIDPSQTRMIERLEQLVPDDADDHLTDALGYAVYGKFYPDLEASWAA